MWVLFGLLHLIIFKYTMPQVDVHEGNTPFVADEENSYLEEQENGSYIFHYAGFTDTVSKEDVESGMYEEYPIIKYNKK